MKVFQVLIVLGSVLFQGSTSSGQCLPDLWLTEGSLDGNVSYQAESELRVSNFWFGSDSEIELTAGNCVLLEPGVDVEEGANFSAFNAWCHPHTNYRALAMHWAPTVYQDLRAKPGTWYDFGIKEDMITAVNFDGDWNVYNNWEHTHLFPLKAVAYYSVQETNSHYFIGYHFYHPRDASGWENDRHENDFEGISLCVRKAAEPFGELNAMTTIKHQDLLRYSHFPELIFENDPVWLYRSLTLDDTGRPEIFISSNGNFYTDLGDFGAHGHGIEGHDGSADAGDYGVVYHVAENGEMPDTNVIFNADGPWEIDCPYELRSINELWYRRWSIGETEANFFTSFGAFGGDDYVTDNRHANAPWNWNNSSKGAGVAFSDPAHAFARLFPVEDLGLPFSHEYIYNPYYTHVVELESVTVLEDTDGFFNGTPDVFIELETGGGEYLGKRVWKKDEIEMDEEQAIWFGAEDATMIGSYGEASRKIYLARPFDTPVRLLVKDADFLGKQAENNNIDPLAAAANSLGQIDVFINEGSTLPSQIYLSSNEKSMVQWSVSALPTEPIPEAPKIVSSDLGNIDWEWVEGFGRFDHVSDYEFSHNGGMSWNTCTSKPQALPLSVDPSQLILRTKADTYQCLNGNTTVDIPPGFPAYFETEIGKNNSTENSDAAIFHAPEWQADFANDPCFSVRKGINDFVLEIVCEHWPGGYYQLVNLNGQVIQSGRLDASRKHEFLAKNWPPGILLFQVWSEQRSATFRLLSP